jgi:hypothetical protein
MTGPEMVPQGGPVEAGCGGCGCLGGYAGGYGGDSSYCLWTDFEYLLWWSKNGQTPPLATVGVPATLGILNTPGTVPVIGGSDFTHEDMSGLRFTLGAWVNQYQDLGVEATVFVLESDTSDHGVATTNAANARVLAQPFVDARTGLESVQVLGGPGLGAGGVFASDTLRFWGADLDAIINLCMGRRYRIDLLAGARYLNVEDTLSVASMTTPAGGGGTQINRRDDFGAFTNYVGGQIGLRTELNWSYFFVNAVGKLSAGSSHEEVKIGGTTLAAVPTAPPVVVPGGFLGLGTNSGKFSRDEFAVAPEVGFNVGAQLTDCIRVYAGYTFLYLNRAVRAGDQIDRTLNLTQQPGLGGVLLGAPRPVPVLSDTDFWVQGLNFGLELRY